MSTKICNEIDYNDNSDSDFVNIETKKSKQELIDNYLFYETENIQDVYYDIKNKFYNISPFFLDHLTLVNLSDFLIYIMFKKKVPTKLSKSKKDFIKIFQSFYHNELNISYNIILNYSYNFKFTIQFEEWILFCLKYTNLSELKHCD